MKSTKSVDILFPKCQTQPISNFFGSQCWVIFDLFMLKTWNDSSSNFIVDSILRITELLSKALWREQRAKETNRQLHCCYKFGQREKEMERQLHYCNKFKAVISAVPIGIHEKSKIIKLLNEGKHYLLLCTGLLPLLKPIFKSNSQQMPSLAISPYCTAATKLEQ